MRPKRRSRGAPQSGRIERSRGAWWLTLGFVALAVLAPAPARAQPLAGESSGPAERRSREQAILEALADSADTGTARSLVEQYLADYASPPREQFGAPKLELERSEAARDRLLAHFREVEMRLREAGIAGEIEARRSAAEAKVQAQLENLAAAALGSSAPEHPLLRSATLPYARRDLAPRPPRALPAIVPSYIQVAPAEPGSSELAGSLEAPLSPEILRQAEAMAHDPVRIFELVRNEVRSELYAGSLRGAEGALRARSGNDVDQSSLLIALLRSSGIPSRYVRGVAVHPIEQLQAELRLASAASVLEALRRAGLAHRPVIRAGRLDAVEVERTWVAAYVPYVNYRGTVIDFSGKTWIPLAPWAKATAGSAPTAVLQAMGFSAEDFLAGYLGAPQSALPLDLVRSAVEAHLATSVPGATYGEQLGETAIVTEALGLLPSSPPFDVAAVTWESAALDESDRGTVRFVVRATESEDSAALLDATLPVAALAGQRVTLSYLPATVDDHRTVILWGGLGSVPAYLVDLRPVLRVAGRQAAVGEALPMGVAHRLELEVSVPGAVETTTQTLLSGSYHALAIGAPTTVPAADAGDDPSSADTEQLAARLLSSVGQSYSAGWDAAEDEIAGLSDLLWLRPIPAVAFASISFTVDNLFDLPWSLRFEGVTLDAALRAAEPVARGTDADVARAGLRLAGLQGSALEHAVFEELFLVDGLSADKGLGLARGAGIDVVLVDAGNVDALLPTLAHPQNVLDEVRDWAVRGMEVAIPRSEIQRNAWRGSAFLVEEPETGAAGYFLSGGLAGGATTEAPENWVLQFLAAALAAPYTEPNPDPLAGTSIRKLEGTDEQTGEVGELLGQPLAIEVRDIAGAPVLGAAVTFVSFSGGGSFVDDEGNESSSLIVLTNPQGVASARFRLGTNTAIEPVFRLQDPADTYTTRFGAHVVEATVATHEGDLGLPAPFAAFAAPGAATHFARTSGSFEEPVDLSELAIWAHSLFVEARDRFENSVSNVAITAAVEMLGATPAECIHPVAVPRAAAVFAREQCGVPVPLLGECGGETATRVTSASGAQFGIISPNEIRPFHVVLEAIAIPSATQVYGILYDHVGGSEICTPLHSGVRIRTSILADEQGNNIQAARPGGTYGPVRFEVLLWDPYEGAACTNCDPCGPSSTGCHPGSPPAGGVWRRGVDGTLQDVGISAALTVSNGGSASPPIQLEPGLFETLATVGAMPGSNLVVADLELAYNRCPQAVCDGSPTFTVDLANQSVMEIWSVLPTISAVAPDPIPLDDADRMDAPVAIDYAIEPAPYHARTAEVILLADGEEVAGGHGTARQGSGELLVQRGFEIDTELDYAAQLVLNRGSAAEVRSDPFLLPLAQHLFAELDESVVLSQDVDVVNQRVCAQPDQFHFLLTREATVTLEFFGVQAMAGGGYEDDGSHITLIADEVRAEGGHDLDVTPADLPPGRYRYVLRGVATGDGIAETREGFALSEYKSRDSLPIGHELVKGIDLFDGHLTLSREDFTIPARGGAALALSFARTYSSEAGGEGGPLGLGWSMNWGSKVLVTPCGEAIVIGGEGSGMRFVDDGAGGLRPLKGYHGSLVANADYSFDFFTRSGNRYHYLRTLGSEWELDSITDPNGNATRLLYEASVEAGERRVSAVVDAAGRTLRLHWEVRQFVFWRGEVIVRVEGPLGIELAFEYDGFGNLTRATREPHAGGGPAPSPSYSEIYRYEIRPQQAFDDHHVLIEVEDEIHGATTRYAYEQGVIGVQGTVGVPRAFVTTVTEPEGGTTGFVYPLAILGSPGVDELDVEVTDRRGKLWRHRLNRYGAPLRREDPLGHVTLTTWTPDDVLVASRTDANGHVTTYTYDSHGNEMTESVTVTDVDNAQHTYTTTTTYEPPANFDPPYIKDRPATRTDKNGNLTELAYDLHGNLLEQAITVHDVDGSSRRLATGLTYFPNGDLKTRTDPLGHLQSFGYDSYGNRTQRIDALHQSTTWTYDLRSRLESETDARGNTTTFAYDALDRRIQVTYPEVDGEAATASVIYDDANRRRTEIDEENRATTTSLDREGRVLSIDNAAAGHKAFDYDDDGNKTLESSWFDGTTAREDTTFVYDDAGRLTERYEPLGKTTVYEYDDAGNVVRETLSDALDPLFLPRVTESRYDALNRRIELSSHLGAERAVRRLLLDGEGNVLAEEDPLGRRALHRYDELHRRIETTAPEWRPGAAKVTQFFFDGNGNRIEERQRNDRQTAAGTWEVADQIRQWRYDALDRIHEVEDAEEKVTTLDYDSVGNLTRGINPRLAVTEHEYDARNRRRLTRQKLDRFTAPARNVVTEFDYDTVGNLIETRLPNGNRIVREVDALNRPTGESDDLGTLSATTYDARGNPKTTTDANGNVTTHHYDALDRLIAQDLPEDRHVASTYDAAGNRLTATDAKDNTTRYQYDQLNRLIQTTAPEPFSFTELFSYDLAGNRLTTTNRRGKTTTYEYDALNRVTKITDPAPLSYERLFVYDAAGNVVSETDRRGIATQTTYDRENRRTSTRRAGLEVERVEYDAAGNRAFVTDANLNITGYQWDERNLLLQENRPLAAITKYRLDDMGDRTEAIDPENRHSLFAYDLRRRQTTSTNGAGETTAYCYDDNGNRTGVRHPKFAVQGDPCADANGRWSYEYDDANRLTAVVDPLLHRTEYEYDGNSNRTVQRDANTHATTFAFDELNRLTGKTYPGGGATETYGYDENGNRTSLTDPKGQSFAYGYDALDRLTTETLPNPAPPTGDELETRTTVYDPNGNVTRQEESYSTSGLAVETQTWDDFDRLLTKTDRHGETISHTYDANGNRKTVRDSDSVVTSYNYDDLNRLASQTGAGGVTTHDYFKNSLPKKTTYPNGASATQAYDLANRTLSIANRQNASLISSYVYDYDDNGNRSSQVETNGGAPEITTYAYDDADRLTAVHYPDQAVTYTLDPVGNRETESIVDAGGTPTSAKTLAYDVRDRLLTLTDSLDPANNATLAWDANGNQISKTSGGLVRGQIYDALDRLVEVQDNGLFLERYSYDPRGLRIRRAGPDGIFRYVRDDGAILQQTDDAGITLARYEWGGDRLVSMQHATEGRSFSLFDGLGSVTAWSKIDGSLALRRTFDAWGKVRSETGATFAPFAFTGHELDEATGLTYSKARFLDTDLGRFLTEDPFSGAADIPPSLHRYLYAYGNPTIYFDPDGRIAVFKNFKEELEQASAEAPDADTGPFTGQADRVLIRAAGSATLSIAAKGVGLLNSAVNVVLSAEAPGSKLGQQAQEEIADAAERIGTAIRRGVERVVEDPKGAVKTVLEIPSNAARGLLDRATGVQPTSERELTQVLAGGIEVAAETAVGGAVVSRLKTGAVIAESATAGGESGVAGETAATRIGKSAHSSLAAANRASGQFDLVNEAIKGRAGEPILVPRRVDLKTGLPQAGTPLQAAIPDAVSFERGQLLDAKPLGRPIAKDRQEIIRAIRAYETREGTLPRQIAVPRYDPATGEFVHTDLYKPEDFIPKQR